MSSRYNRTIFRHPTGSAETISGASLLLLALRLTSGRRA